MENSRTWVMGLVLRRTTWRPTTASPRDLRTKSIRPVSPMVWRAASRTSCRVIMPSCSISASTITSAANLSLRTAQRLGSPAATASKSRNSSLCFFVFFSGAVFFGFGSSRGCWGLRLIRSRRWRRSSLTVEHAGLE
ncbi:uncharacterized protein M6B38_408065 [Iris pallida]|uniref:Uncharacterized protein n=1 Tax=Iris pallida TaxID=29817 RepID=A0AAX6FPK3_IRIPA|nr:uncharacterized protein M6B38_408065 [Iris pallida]